MGWKGKPMNESEPILEHEEVRKIIEDTVNATVIKLKMSGLMKDNRKTAYEKTEELLKNYNTFRNIKGHPCTKRIVKRIDLALKEIDADIYYDIIPMYYFDQMTRESIAEHFRTSERTITRNKSRLINLLKVKLFSDDVIFELFL